MASDGEDKPNRPGLSHQSPPLKGKQRVTSLVLLLRRPACRLARLRSLREVTALYRSVVPEDSDRCVIRGRVQDQPQNCPALVKDAAESTRDDVLTFSVSMPAQRHCLEVRSEKLWP